MSDCEQAKMKSEICCRKVHMTQKKNERTEELQLFHIQELSQSTDGRVTECHNTTVKEDWELHDCDPNRSAVLK